MMTVFLVGVSHRGCGGYLCDPGKSYCLRSSPILGRSCQVFVLSAVVSEA